MIGEAQAENAAGVSFFRAEEIEKAKADSFDTVGSAKPPSTIKDAGAIGAVREALAATDQPFRNAIIPNYSDDRR